MVAALLPKKQRGRYSADRSIRHLDPRPKMSASAEIYFGPYCLRGRSGPLLLEGVEVKLQPRTLALLWALVNQPGEVIAKSALLNAIWPGQAVGDDALSFQVQALRRALHEDPKTPIYVLTAHRVGVRFGVPVTRSNAQASAQAGVALMGRDAELKHLHAAWQAALDGDTRLLFVTGEAGIGKSALLAGFQRQVAAEHPKSLWARGQCLEHTGTSEPYLPVLEALGHLLRKTADEKTIELMKRLAPSWLLLLPELMEDAEYALLKQKNVGVAKERMLRELAEALEQMSLSQGLLLVIEDLHWADAATLELISFLAQRQVPSRLLVLVSFRPADAIAAAHPVRRWQLKLKASALADEMPLQALSATAVQAYLDTRLALSRYGAELPQRVFERCGGQPLFMVQITDYLQQRPDDVDTLAAHLHEVIPEALRDLISLQLNDLTPADVKVLEAASVAGAEFSAAAVSAATGLGLDAVEQQLEQLADPARFIGSAGLSIWPNGTTSGLYRFRHALYAQVLRKQLVDSRRARMHRQIAEHAEAAFGDRSADIAGELALHFEQGGLRARALRYRLQTARKALERVAVEAVQQETALGLKLLDAVHEGPERDHAELALRVLAAHGQQTEHGYTTTHANTHFGRIAQLVEICTDPQLLEMGLFCLWVRRHFQCRFEEALGYAERLREQGVRLNSPMLEVSGDVFAALNLHLSGRFVEANQHSERALGAMKPLDGALFGRVMDIRGTALTARALLRWLLGYPDQALRTAREAHANAVASGNPYAICMSRVTTLNNILAYRREWPQLLTEAADSLKVCEQYGHRDGLVWARRQYAVALAMTGQSSEGLPMLWRTLHTLREQASLMGLPLDYTLGAECCIGLGDFERARWALDAAWSIIKSHHAVAFESETRRMEGELAMAQGSAQQRDADATAESHFTQAIDAAQRRSAPVLQLRAALSLGRLWQRQGRTQEALQKLQPLYAGFSEGHDSPDLVLAAGFISQLSEKAATLA